MYQINNHHQNGELGAALLDVYDRLHRHYGYEAHWWPIFTSNWRWEIMLGSILVQQTQWERVEQAVKALDALGLVDEQALSVAPIDLVVEAIRPVAYYNAKGPALVALARHIVDHHGGATARMFEQPTTTARAELLARTNIGPETADTMLLYAGHHPVFVVDAYLRRLFGRLGIIPGVLTLRYEPLRALLEQALPEDIDLSAYPHLDGDRARFFWDYHALIVEHCIHHCLARRPRCDQTSAPRRSFSQPIKCAGHCPPCNGCPLREACAAYQSGEAARL
jgi:endonuclease III related protein